jgi:hypothetical protein
MMVRSDKPPPRRMKQAARKKAQPKGFRPTAAMLRFLRMELELLAKRRPYTQKQVAEASGVSEGQASRWHAVDGYDQWVAVELRHVAIQLFARGAVAAGHRVILTGDPRELETFGRVMGLLEPSIVEPRVSDGAGHTTINLLCPRPEIPQGSLAVTQQMTRLPPPDLPPSPDPVLVAQLYARK